jgi:ATP-binding cassette, subfamily B, bacterial
MRRPMPVVLQLEMADCGAACLAMTLEWHGKIVGLPELRDQIGTGAVGSRASTILDAGLRHGLLGRGVRLEPESLKFLPRGSILHWSLAHFVVYDGLSRKGVRIVDPAVGRRVIGPKEFSRQFTGVALILEPGEGFRPGGRRDNRIWHYYCRRILERRRALGRVALVSAFVQLFGLALPLFTGLLVDQVLPNRDLDLLTVVAAGAASLVLFQILASLTRSYLLLNLRTSFDAELSMDFVSHLVRLPYSFFLRRSVGDLTSRYASNRMIMDMLTSASLSTLIDGMLVISYLGLILAISPVLGLLVSTLGVLHLGGFLVSYRRIRELQSQDLEAQARAQSQLIGMVQGMESLKASGYETLAVRRWSHRLIDALNIGLARGRLSASVDAWRYALDVGAPLAILIAGAWLVLQSRLTLGTMLAANGLALGFLRPFSGLLSTAFRMQELRSHVERVQEVITTPGEIVASARTAPTLRGDIAVESVSFRYDKSGPEILREVSFRISAGQTLAVVGKSGAGKSTLARLLIGLDRATTGRILYDECDLVEVEPNSLRSQIGIITQRSHLFGTTIRDNIALFDPHVSQEAMVEAAILAQIHDDIERLPMGYATPLLDGAPSLSGGQRQRIAIARALVRKPAILVLDEATSELDTVTESRIMSGIRGLGCTRVVIAHRLSTVEHADLIVVLDDGRVSESGSHRELVGASGVYASLIAAQSVG